MNTHDTSVQETSPQGLDRCNCPQCLGRKGTARVCFNSRKLAARARGNTLAKTAGLFLLLSCCMLQGQASAGVTKQAVESAPRGQDANVSSGYLEVFSTTQQSQWGEGSYYYPHTGYRIYGPDGKMMEWVDNHNTSTDEDPQKVELAPGTYTIWAQSDRSGYVKIPIEVKPGRTTAIHLENDRPSDKEANNPAKVVTTSSGQVVGWKA